MLAINTIIYSRQANPWQLVPNGWWWHMTSGSGPAPFSTGPEWWDDGDEDSSGLVEVLTMPQEIADELAAEVQARAADLFFLR